MGWAVWFGSGKRGTWCCIFLGNVGRRVSVSDLNFKLVSLAFLFYAFGSTGLYKALPGLAGLQMAPTRLTIS